MSGSVLALLSGGIEVEQDLDGRVFGSPTLYGNSVYVGTERGTIYCMDAQTLTIIWEITLQEEGAIVASPAIDTAGYVYVAVSYEPNWSAYLNATTNPEYGTYSIFKLSPGGAKIWRFLSSYVLHSTPVVDETNEKFARVEQIKKFRMIPKELDHEDGELTATQKLKRKAMEEQFADLVADMY